MRIRSRHVRSCAEPLEDRRLLSAAAPVAVQVIEIDVASEDQDLKVTPAQLPQSVINVVAEKIAGVKIIDASFSTDDGPEYDLTVKRDGATTNLTVTKHGEVLEVAQDITASDLPQAVRDWVSQDFPGAHIDEAWRVVKSGKLEYDLLIDSGTTPRVEAAVRVLSAAEQKTFATTLPQRGKDFEPASESDAASDELLSEAQNPKVVKGVSPTLMQSIPARSADLVINLAGNVGREAPEPRGAASRPIAPVTAPAEVMAQAVFSGVAPIAQVENMADVARNLFVANLLALESRLGETLSLLGQRAAASPISQRAEVGAVAVSGVLAAMYLLRPARRALGGQVVLADSDDESWSWVVGRPPR